jgi:hypothetical protein
MKKTLKIVAVILFGAFFIAQFIRPDRTNPPTVQAETLEASTQMPDDVKKILARSCADCHTNTTAYPWYSNVTPANFFLAHHIEEGRQTLNFSIWNTYELRRKRRKLDEICEQATSGEMPLPSYLWIHADAKMSDEEIKTLCDWADAEKARLESGQ